jgi:hypothetical protein
MIEIASALRRLGGTYNERIIERKEPIFEASPEASEATPSDPVTIDEAVSSWVREITTTRQTRSPNPARLGTIVAICILAATIGVSLAGFQIFFVAPGPSSIDRKASCSEGAARPGAPCVASQSNREPVLPATPEKSAAAPKAAPAISTTSGGLPAPVPPAKKPPPIEQKAPAPKSKTASILRNQSTSKITTPLPETKPGTIDGWSVREVNGGTAVLDGPRGAWRVKRGDSVPGLGRVDSILQWGNRWIVATSAGLVSTP